MIAAAGRSSAGTSDHASSSSSSTVRAPSAKREQQAVLAVVAVADVLLQLRLRLPDRGAVAGAQHIEVERAQVHQPVQVARQARPGRGR